MRKVIATWFVLLFLFLPIDYRILPSIGLFLSKILLPINDYITSTFFNISVLNTFDKSDSLAFYCGAIVLLIVVIVFHLLIKKEYLNLRTLSFILIGFLSYYLIRYGFDKIVGMQFYAASPNTLHTKLGNISKDLLFWNSMGASSFYNWFMAISEISAGLLLLINRTRFIGLLFAIGIMLNVFALNIGYDITVKFLSGLLLFTGIFLLSYYRNRLAQLVGSKHHTSDLEINYSLNPLVNRVVLGCFLSFLILENLLPAFTNHQHFPLAGKTYKIVDSPQFDFVHFHPDSYLIFQKEEVFQSYPAIITSKEIKIQHDNYTYHVSNDTLYLVMNNQSIIGIEYANQSMPLRQDQTHIYLEEMLP